MIFAFRYIWLKFNGFHARTLKFGVWILKLERRWDTSLTLKSVVFVRKKKSLFSRKLRVPKGNLSYGPYGEVPPKRGNFS